MPKIGDQPKAIAFANWSVWVKKLKMPKGCEKRFYNPIRVAVCKKPLKKKDIILKKLGHFENGQNWPRCIGYSPCKMVSLGQKLKMPKRCEKGIVRPH